MVSLARTQDDPSHRVLICSVHTGCVPLREMLSLLLTRRDIHHRIFESLPRLLEFLSTLSPAEEQVRVVTMVGPGLRPTDVAQLDTILGMLRCPVALVVFDDALEAAPASWDDARVVPCLRSPIPPRFSDLLRVVGPQSD